MRHNSRKKLLLRFDRILSQGFWSQLLILAVLMVFAFVFANLLLLLTPVDWAEFCELKGISRWSAPLYLLIDGNAFTSVYEESSSRWTVFLACIIYVIGVFLFTGMTVSVITNIIERRVEKHRGGLVYYLKKDHYIIMGYDDSITSFIGHIFETDPEAFILIFTSRDSVKVQEYLLRSFTQKQLEKVIINYGHRTSVEDYPKIHLETAKELFIVGYMEGPAHDAKNVECVDAVYRFLSRPDITSRPSTITCVFRDLDTYVAFKTTDIFTKISKLGIEFVPFNYHSAWARQVFVEHAYRDQNGDGKTYQYPLVYREGISKEDPHRVHLVFVGTTNVAVAFATEAAHLLHFPNYERDHKLKTWITFIEVNADKEKDEFITRYRQFFEVQPYLYRDMSDRTVSSVPAPVVCDEYINKAAFSSSGNHYDYLDVEFEFIKGDIFSLRVQNLIAEWAKDDQNQYLSIFLALNNQRTNFVMAMNMPEEVYDRAVPVFIRQARSDNFVTNLRETSVEKGPEDYSHFTTACKVLEEKLPSRYSNIYPFGMYESVFLRNDVCLRRAKLINYLYTTADYASYKFKGEFELIATPSEEIWRDADRYWKELGVDYKWSNLYNAYTLDIKLSSVLAKRKKHYDYCGEISNLSDDEIEILARVEHNRWNVEKLLMGYRIPLPEEDPYCYQKLVASGTGKDDDIKKLKKNKGHHIHHDIRPFEKLSHISELDKEFSRSIPWIVSMDDKIG